MIDEVIRRRLDVLDAVETQGTVVEIDEALAKTRRTPDIRRQDADATLHQGLVDTVEAGPFLPLGPTVEA